MTAPTFAPVWCSEALVVAWLKMSVILPIDSQLISLCCASIEPQVQRARPDQYVDEPADPDDPASPTVRVYRPDAEVIRTAVMLAGKVYRRRNSPSGKESVFDSVTYVANYDPEIQEGLRRGLGPTGHRPPVVDAPPPGPYCYAGIW